VAQTFGRIEPFPQTKGSRMTPIRVGYHSLLNRVALCSNRGVTPGWARGTIPRARMTAADADKSK